MKLISRIKASQPPLIVPGPVVEVHPPTTAVVAFPPTDPPIMATHGPYGVEIGAPEKGFFDLDIGKVELAIQNSMADALAKKIDEDMLTGTMSAQTAAVPNTILTEKASKSLLDAFSKLPSLKKSLSKHVDSFLAFPQEAKGGEIVGAWQAVVESVEKVYESQTYKVALRVMQGKDAGTVHILQVGDTISVNYKLSLG